MNKYKQSFRLVQHTPMIHFQAAQLGATLRASDVKPAIDRYVWRSLQRRHPQIWDEYRTCINSENFCKPDAENKSASAYRIHIQGTPEAFYLPTAYLKGNEKSGVEQAIKRYYGESLANQRIQVLSGTPFFANVDKIKDQKWEDARLAVMYQQMVLTVFATDTKVKELVCQILPYVFASQNFGTRSSKGFGNFLLAHDGVQALEKTASYRFKIRAVNKPDNVAFERMFEKLLLVYNALRSGINVPMQGRKFYCKSLLFKYFYDQGIQWDKKSIKQTYYNGKLRRQQEDWSSTKGEEFPVHYNSKQAHLVRDLLGLASEQSWGRAYDNDDISKKGLNKKDGNELIQRFASPLWFKPVRSADRKSFMVYLGYHPVPEQYLGESLGIMSKANPHKSLSLKTPSMFDLGDYLDFAFGVNLEEHIEDRYQDRPEYEDLAGIFESIKRL